MIIRKAQPGEVQASILRRSESWGARSAYLRNVPEEYKALVVDPDTLPDLPHTQRRIMLITDTLALGGAERTIETAARMLSGAGHVVTVWALRRGQGHVMQDVGTATILCGTQDELQQHASRARVELAVFSNGAGVESAAALHARGVQCLVMPYGLVEWNFQRMGGPELWQHLAGLWAFRAVAGGMLQRGITLPAYKFLGPIELARYPYKERELRGGPIRLCYCGRMSHEKNLGGLLEVVELVRKRHPRLEFHVIGGVDTKAPPDHVAYWQKVSNEIHALPLWRELERREVLIDHGMVYEGVQELIDSMHFMVLASDFEAEPMVYMEAMASGCVCVGRHLGEIGPLLQDAGVLVEPRSRRMGPAEAQEMANGILRVIRSKVLYKQLARAARRRLEEEHDTTVWLRRTVRTYEAVLAKATREAGNQVAGLERHQGEGGAYGDLLWGHPDVHPWLGPVRDLARELSPEGSVVVEIGAGGGRWSRYLWERAAKVILVDGTKASESAIRRDCLPPEGRVEYVVSPTGDLEGVPTSSVDAVFSFDTFVHFHDQLFARYVQEVGRVLKPGGKFALHYATELGPLLHFFRYYSPEEVVAMLAQAGMHVERVVGQYGPPSGGSRLVLAVKG